VNGNDEIHRLINAIALKNAMEHSGRTNVNTVLAKILSLKPELKNEIKTLIEEIKTIVDSVNKLDLEQQKKNLGEIDSAESKVELKSPQEAMGSHTLPELKMTGTKVDTQKQR
jgi:ethanolamine utilization cobalamin adenosyltransferase